MSQMLNLYNTSMSMSQMLNLYNTIMTMSQILNFVTISLSIINLLCQQSHQYELFDISYIMHAVNSIMV